MGNTSYNFTSRSLRSESVYKRKSVNEIFTQNTKRQIHEQMDPKKALLREARDSQEHPQTVPTIIALDVTGSMGKIPHELVKEGLPKMMAGIIERGILDPQILFLAVGDTQCDSYPLQVGQFESGDEELDLWLTRTYIEGGGGGNAGESYLLAYYFAAFHTSIDSWEKRNTKGFIFTIGDEPSLQSLPKNVMRELMGEEPQASYTDTELLAKAQEQYNVFHLHIMETHSGPRSKGYWKNLLGQNSIEIADHRDVSRVIAETVVAHTTIVNTEPISPTVANAETSSEQPHIIL